MIGLPAGTKVFLACQPIDLRAGFDGLAAKVQQIIGADPFSGHVFIFRSKHGHYLKGLYWTPSFRLRDGPVRQNGKHPFATRYRAFEGPLPPPSVPATAWG